MRIDHSVSASTHPRGWGPAADAPTYLPSDEAVLPLRHVKSDSVITSAPKKAKQSVQPDARAIQSRNASQSTIKPPKQQGAKQQPVDAPPVEAPLVAAAAPQAIPPFIPFEGGASFDPLAIPLPPDLAPAVYGWLRRLALQADLAGADRLLRDALADLTSALQVLIIYAGPDGLHSIGANDEMPKDMQPVLAVAKSRRALVGTHSALIPITTSSDTIAVIQLVRNARQPAFNMVDNVTMAAVARESASIMHHLVVEHVQRRVELEADKKSLYRPEALDNHRRRGQEGVVTELSPGWIRATYYFLLAALAVGIVVSIVVHVPTYSSGYGVVMYPGTPMTAPAPGTVDKIYVEAQTDVKRGMPLVKLKSEKEESDERQATTELDAALQSYLFDPADESIRKALVSAQASARRAADAIEQRTVRATVDGTVSDVRVAEGKSVNFGDPILTIVAPGTQPELWALMPGNDRPRFRLGQEMQVELTGFQKKREHAKIFDIALSNTGTTMARNLLGVELADSLKLSPEGGSYVLVKAKLPKNTFRAKGKTYRYYTGMATKIEVKVEDKRFISTLLPSLEKYVE